MFDFDDLDDAEEAKPETAPVAAGPAAPAAEVHLSHEPSAEDAPAKQAQEKNLVSKKDATVADQDSTSAFSMTATPAEKCPAPTATTPEAYASLAAKPNSRYSPGMILESVSTVLVRAKEDLQSEEVVRLPVGSCVKVLDIGKGPGGKRIHVHAMRGGEEKGWVSVVATNTAPLWKISDKVEASRVEAGQEKTAEEPQPNIFVGAGQALGGSASSSDPRAAALAAAERRQASALSHGVGDEKAKQLRESGQREAVLRKISEIYAKRREEAPMSLQSASLDALQKHLDFLQRPGVFTHPSPEVVCPTATSSQEQFNPPSRSSSSSTWPVQSQGSLLQEAAASYGLCRREVEAITELENLGFDTAQALEAFLACERNQELAANYLFENQASGDARTPGLVSRNLPPAFPGPPPDESRLSLPQLQWNAIRRLQELGFDRPTALKAYLACGRDEEEAGNRLLI